MSSPDEMKKLQKRIKELEEDLMEATELYYEEGFDAGFVLGEAEGYDNGRLAGWEEYNNEVELTLHDYKGKVH